MNHNITPHPSELPSLLKPESTLRIPVDQYIVKAHLEWYDISGLCPYSIGDTLTVLEEWARAWYGVIYKSTHKPESYPSNPLWQPAETMPPEFSRIKRTVAGVGVEQLWEFIDTKAMENYAREPLDTNWGALKNTAVEEWNTIHPDNPYDPELYCWTIKLKEAE